MDTTIKSLKKQWEEDQRIEEYVDWHILSLLEKLGIEERGGGPEGLYYTHPLLNGEYLYRNLPKMLKDISKLLPPFTNVNEPNTE